MRTCVLVNYAIDPDALASVLPAGIQTAEVAGAAWLSVVVADMSRLRPRRLPARLGVSFRQIVYRAVVEHRGERGVHFLRSDADHRPACIAGNALSVFRFHHADIALSSPGPGLTARVTTRDGNADLAIDAHTAPTGTWTTRLGSLDRLRAELVELFVAFDHDPVRDEHQTLRIDRGRWDLQPLAPEGVTSAFMERGPVLNRSTASLDSIVLARDVPYHWHPLTTRPVRTSLRRPMGDHDGDR